MKKDLPHVHEATTRRQRSIWPVSKVVRTAVSQDNWQAEAKSYLDKPIKHILFLVSSMQGGGAERVAALLCNHWATQGHQVTLMPTFSGRGECFYPLDSRVRLDYLADRVGTTKQTAWNQLRRLRALRQIIRCEKPDVVIAFLSHVNIAAILASTGSGVPIVVSERVHPPMLGLSRGLDFLRRWLYPRASTVVMQTNQGCDWLASAAPRARGQVVPNPVVYPLPAGEPCIEPNEAVAGNRKVILAVGRLAEQKRLVWVVDAFAGLARRHPRWDLVILGEGTERGRLERLVEQNTLGSRIQLPGRVGNLAEWYLRADLYVLSSCFEGFPNTLVEAMAHGLPVISVDCDTGPRDIIRHDLDGVLVASDDNGRELMQTLNALMSDPRRRTRLAEAAIEVRTRFSMERVAADWDRVLGLA